MEKEYSYASLIKMKKKSVIKIAGYRNIKAMYDAGIGRSIVNGMVVQEVLSKKYIARQIASDR